MYILSPFSSMSISKREKRKEKKNCTCSDFSNFSVIFNFLRFGEAASIQISSCFSKCGGWGEAKESEFVWRKFGGAKADSQELPWVHILLDYQCRVDLKSIIGLDWIVSIATFLHTLINKSWLLHHSLFESLQKKEEEELFFFNFKNKKKKGPLGESNPGPLPP